MAITTQLGGIRRNESIFTTVIPISMLVDLTVPGMAFEPKEVRLVGWSGPAAAMRLVREGRDDYQRSIRSKSD